MEIRYHNTDRLDPEELYLNPRVVHYFADTKMCMKHLLFPLGFARVLMVPIDHAFQADRQVHQLIFDFAETRLPDLPREFARFFGRFPRVRECYRSLLNLNWPKGDRSPVEDDTLRTKQGGIVICRQLRNCGRIYSPFARLPWVSGEPPKWTTVELARLLANGQWTEVVRRSSAVGAAGEHEPVREPFSAESLARMLIEDETTWDITKRGPAIHVVGRHIEPQTELEIVRTFEIQPAFYT